MAALLFREGVCVSIKLPAYEAAVGQMSKCNDREGPDHHSFSV